MFTSRPSHSRSSLAVLNRLARLLHPNPFENMRIKRRTERSAQHHSGVMTLDHPLAQPLPSHAPGSTREGCTMCT